MTVLTIYGNKFDSMENVFGGNGMSGKAFLEEVDGHGESGQEFKSIDDALDFCVNSKTKVDRIEFMYLSNDGTQKFAKFVTTQEW